MTQDSAHLDHFRRRALSRPATLEAYANSIAKWLAVGWLAGFSYCHLADRGAASLVRPIGVMLL